MSNTGLTKQELQILSLRASGMTCNEVGRELDIGSGTVRTHSQNTMIKLQVRSTLSTLLIAIRDGDIDPDQIEVMKRGW